MCEMEKEMPTEGLEQNSCTLPANSACTNKSGCRNCGWNQEEHERRVQQLHTRGGMKIRHVRLPGAKTKVPLLSLIVRKHDPEEEN